MSILSDPEIVDLIKNKFVPVAVDQHDHRRRKDGDGELFAKVLKQAGRGLDGMAQGFYLFSADGQLLGFSNATTGPEMKRLIAAGLKKFEPTGEALPIEKGERDARFVYEPPEGGLVVRIIAKVLGGYEDGKGGNAAIYQNALGRDHLWLRKDEAEALVRDELPQSVAARLARFHLVDNTRGEPPFWRADELQKLDLTLKQGRLAGAVHLETKSGDRGYLAQLLGFVKAKESKVTRFDLVAKGQFWGEGAFTRNAPKGKFPFAVAATLVAANDSDRSVPPGAARGNLAAYLR